LLKDAPLLERPIGLFPEGAAGRAGQLTAPLPGVERLIVKLNRPAVPVAISETDRLRIRFGAPIGRAELRESPNAAQLLLDRVADLLRG
jgi:1-acyl-sn-glycerol-3-phosphate acyltransferase